MSLKDSLIDVLDQGDTYKEQSVGEPAKSDDKGTNVEENTSTETTDDPKSTEQSVRKIRKNPFKKDKDDNNDAPSDKKGLLKFVLIGLAVVVLIILFVVVYSYMTRDKGAEFLEEMGSGEYTPFQYTMEERETLRANGYTGDDIERYEVEERSVPELVEMSENLRKEQYDKDIKPYLDGASEEYHTLEDYTWLGGSPMEERIITDAELPYDNCMDTCNLDYDKVPARGAQLWLKLDWVDKGQTIFILISPSRYSELPDSGNIVVDVSYQLYDDGAVCVTDVREKSIVD